MNIIGTATLAGALIALPGLGLNVTSLSALNPIGSAQISAGGMGLEIDTDGLRAEPAKAQGFEIEIRLKTGTPIKVSF